MRRFFQLLAVAGFATLIALPVTSAVEDEDEKELKKAREALLKLSDVVAKGDKAAIDKQVAAVVKDNKLEPIMHQLKLRRRGGIGFGEKPLRVSFKDGIEAKYRDMSMKALTSRELKKDKDDLIRMARITIALAKITHLHAPKEKADDKDPADWKTWSKEMEASANDLVKAIEKQDAVAVRTAARGVNNRCSACHGVFRTLD